MWTLIDQIFVQLFLLHAPLLPIIRDNSLPVHSFWFCLTLTLSAITTVVSAIVYGKSWQASTLLSYASGGFGMMASAQLAGSIKDFASAHNLGH
jgi:hypothetical protein